MKKTNLFFTFALLSVAGNAVAAVSAEEAAQLGRNLTPVGAERAGNADGSIPAWTGGLDKAAGNPGPLGVPSDPFANDKPLFSITAKNVAQYKDHLSAGQIAMFEHYPETYRMDIYPTHRSAALPDDIYQAIARNAVNAKLVSDGNGIEGFDRGTPFPIPKSGLEVVWNHTLHYFGGSARRSQVMVTPLANGDFVPVHVQQQITYRENMKEYDPKNPDNMMYYYKERITSPARLAGNVVLAHDSLNQVDQPRMAWMYNAGQRRVRRAPQVAYDGPYPGSEGIMTTDSNQMFNGAPDRYDWKLIGKKEVYVPYNNFKLDDPKNKYSDIVRPGHVNPDVMRYELHRVWVVEATLKQSARHIYSKRELYFDEDTWIALLADQYDSRGVLWRVSEGTLVPLYDIQLPWLSVQNLYDLSNGRYMVNGLRNEEKEPMEFGFKSAMSEYTPASLRNAGVR